MDEMTNPERLRELRLTGLLHDLVEEHGRGKAAEELGVDRKTLWRCMNSGKLTPTLAEALERRMLAGQRSDLGRQRARLDTLEERVEALAGALSAGLDAVRSEVEAVAGMQAEALGPWQRRLAEVEARGAGRDGTQATVPPAVKGAPQPVIGKPAVSKPWRPYPQLVTLEPEAGEELIYGAATPPHRGVAAGERGAHRQGQTPAGPGHRLGTHAGAGDRPHWGARTDAGPGRLPLERHGARPGGVAPGAVAGGRARGAQVGAVLALGAARGHARVVVEVASVAGVSRSR